MSTGSYDVAIVGGGHNGLVAAAYCARAGLRTVVLERRPLLGGATLTDEVWPGYRLSVASYVCSLFDPRIVAELDLRAHGYDVYRKDPASFTPLADGRSLLLSGADADNAREIAAFDARDVAGLAAFEREATRLGGLLADSFDDPDPSFEKFPDDVQATLRGSAAELVERYVRTPVLAATLATDGLIGTEAGPRDPGTAYVLAHHYAGRAVGAQGVWGFVRGGMGAIATALASAARAAGAELRTGAAVARIALRDGRAARLELADGGVVEAGAILVNADPKTLFLGLLDPGDVPGALLARARAWRSNGVAFKLNLALGELPDFTARPGTHAAAAPPRHDPHRARRRLPASGARRRARAGRVARADAGVLHAVADRSEHGPARQARHVDLRPVLPLRAPRPALGAGRPRRDRRPADRDAGAVRAQPAGRDRAPPGPGRARHRER